MRITGLMLRDAALRGIRANAEQLARAQDEVATGRKVRTVSDNPVDAAQIMRLASQLRDMDQYRRNGTAATTRLNTEDLVLATVRKLLDQARGLAINVTSDDPADPTRQDALAAIQQIRSQIIGLGNTQVGDEYIFGGGQTQSPPFFSNGTYAGDTNPRRVELNSGIVMDVNHTGDAIFSPAIAALDALAVELATGTAASIQATVPGIAAADAAALGAQAEVGIRLGQVKFTGEQLAQSAASLMEELARVRDADPAESSVKLLSAQSALERAYAAVGRVLSVNLLDYL